MKKKRFLIRDKNYCTELSTRLCSGIVDTDSDGSSCEDESCGCHTGEDYCRSSQIINLRVTKATHPDLYYAVKAITKAAASNPRKEEQKVLPLDRVDYVDYCVERLLRLHHVWDTSLWKVFTFNGYYGEEVGDITFDGFKELVSDIVEMLDLPPDERIRYVLRKEYGLLLPELEDATFSIVSAAVDSLHPANLIHMQKLNVMNIIPTKMKLPIGIYRDTYGPNQQGYSLIDGHHRLTEAKRGHKNKKVDIILAKLSSVTNL